MGRYKTGLTYDVYLSLCQVLPALAVVAGVDCGLTSLSLSLCQVLTSLSLSLCQVLPALAVVAGVDRGLRVGGACVHRPSSRRAVVLGMLKQGLSSVRLQWDDGDAAVRWVRRSRRHGQSVYRCC